MIYVVTGHARSGTSCMMGCLIASALPANYRADQDGWVLKKRPPKDGYHPNPKGFFEGFRVPFEQGENMVTKMTMRRFRKVQSGSRMKVIVMYRPFEERKASIEAWDNNLEAVADFRTGLLRVREHKPKAEYRLLHYHNLLTAPGAVFDALVSWGWPLTNRDAFVNWVDPTLYRNRVVQDLPGVLRDVPADVACGVQCLLPGSGADAGELQ